MKVYTISHRGKRLIGIGQGSQMQIMIKMSEVGKLIEMLQGALATEQKRSSS